MANFSLTNFLKLKRIKPGERDWAKEEVSNWDMIDQFSQWIANILELANIGPFVVTPPTFNNTYNTIEIKGSLVEPSSAVYSYDIDGRVIQGIEEFYDLGMTRTTQYSYRTDGKLSHITSDFDGIIRTETFMYTDEGKLAGIQTEEIPNGSF